MKQCPVCKNTYTDESLIFCLSDGTRLNEFYDTAATIQLPNGVKPTEANYGRVNIPVNSVSTETKIIPPVVLTNQTEKKGCSPFVIASVLGLIGILAMAGIGIVYFSFKDDLVVQNNSATPTPNVFQNNNSNSLNSNEQELKDKLDKLQKQLDEQKKTANKSTPSTNSTPSPTSAKTAQVNSPADGFLAMRSGPSHKSGSQITKMPHGATINVYNCQNSTTIAGKTGRWCQVSYGGSNGWAFDAWLVY